MSSKTKKIVLKRNKKLDKIYHLDSGLVVNSAKEKLVVGRIENDEFVVLDQTALDLCKKFDLKYDETLVDSDDDEEDEEDNEVNSEKEEEEKEEEEKEEETKAVSRKSSVQETKKSDSSTEAKVAELMLSTQKKLLELVKQMTPDKDSSSGEELEKVKAELEDTKVELAKVKKDLSKAKKKIQLFLEEE